MSDYKLEPKSIVDELAQFIRQVDGNNKMGAGSLAEKICERFHVGSLDVQQRPVECSDGCPPQQVCDCCQIAAPQLKKFQKAASCVGCEGSPAPENSPCAVCGQQHEPDVSALVEALEVMVEMVELGGFGKAYAMDIARAALASHRKGGSDDE